MSHKTLMVPVQVEVTDGKVGGVTMPTLNECQQALDRAGKHARSFQELLMRSVDLMGGGSHNPEEAQELADLLEKVLSLGIESGHGVVSSEVATLVHVDNAKALAEALLRDEDECGGGGYGISGKAYGLLYETLLEPLGIKLRVDATDDRFYIAGSEDEHDEEHAEADADAQFFADNGEY